LNFSICHEISEKINKVPGLHIGLYVSGLKCSTPGNSNPKRPLFLHDKNSTLFNHEKPPS